MNAPTEARVIAWRVADYTGKYDERHTPREVPTEGDLVFVADEPDPREWPAFTRWLAHAAQKRHAFAELDFVDDADGGNIFRIVFHNEGNRS